MNKREKIEITKYLYYKEDRLSLKYKALCDEHSKRRMTTSDLFDEIIALNEYDQFKTISNDIFNILRLNK